MNLPNNARSRSVRWVCPSDRQLALRAKLRTGWSVKSSSLDSRLSDFNPCSPSYPASPSTPAKNFALTDEERQRIIEVIQRAEALDQSEQVRVGKLVERLDNMKRNVSIVTSTRSGGQTCPGRCIRGNKCVCCCALCGEKFSVLGAGPTLCRDCRKYVCQKCGVETTTPPPAGKQDPQAPQRIKSAPSIANLTSTGSVTSGQPVGAPTKVFLCRICTETREMWKKSGAWFFKSLPKYILPEKKKAPTGPRNSTWALAGPSRSLEPSEQDSSSDDDGSSRRSGRNRLCVSASVSSDATEPRSDTVEVEVHTSPKQSQMPMETEAAASASQFPGQLAVPSASSSSPSPSSPLSATSPTPSRSSSRLREKLEPQPTPTAVFYVRCPGGSSEPLDPDLGKKPQRNSIGSEPSEGGGRGPVGSRRPSINSDASSCETDSSGIPMRRDHDPIQQLYALRPMANSSSSSASEMDERTASYGTLEMSLRYDPAAQCLQCKVERARALRPMDIHGLADPFCKLNIQPIELSPSSACPTRLRTKTVHRTRDPEFNELLNFYGITESDMKSEKALHVLILQDDEAGRDFLGEAKFPLRELQPYQTKFYNVSLMDHYQADHEEMVWGEDMSNGRGQIHLVLSYCTRRRVLLVCVERASNLLAMDNNGLSDPFVKLNLVTEPNADDPKPLQARFFKHQLKQKKAGMHHTTKIKWKTLNPVWNEEFSFDVRLTDLATLALVFSVWDKDFGKKNDFLGSLVLSCNSKGARLRHWVDVMKFPDRRHQACHELTKDNVRI